MTKSLWRDSNQDFIINDDSEAKAFLAFLGILNYFADKPSFPSVQMVTHGDYASHYIAALLFSGHKNSADNGYMIFAWGKSNHSFDQSEGHIKDLWKQFGTRAGAKWIRHKPEKN